MICTEGDNQTINSQITNNPPPSAKYTGKQNTPFTVLLILIIILSLSGNIFLIYQNTQKQTELTQKQNELYEYQLQISKLADAIEQYENQNAGAKTYYAIKSWWDATKSFITDAKEYNEYLEEEENKK